jgi:hypothetical protein
MPVFDEDGKAIPMLDHIPENLSQIIRHTGIDGIEYKDRSEAAARQKVNALKEILGGYCLGSDTDYIAKIIYNNINKIDSIIYRDEKIEMAVKRIKKEE